MSQWEGTDEGRRPTRESIQPTVKRLLEEHAEEALMALAITRDELSTMLTRMPIKTLYVFHEALIRMAYKLENGY